MMKRILIFSAVPALAMCLSGCPSATAVHRASTAAAGIGDGLSQFATLNHQLIQQSVVTAQEGSQMATLIDKAALANDAFVKTLQGIPDTGTSITAQQVLTAFSTMQAQVLNLQTEGVLGLKSADAQAKFGAVMTSIQAGIAAAEVVIAANTPAATAPAPQSNKGHAPLAPLGLPILALAGIVFTPSEIEELISLALAAGSALVVKLEQLRGKTDVELQTEALASDAAAEQQATADELPQS